MNSKQPPALSPEIIDGLRNRYGEPEIPKCRVCGGALSVQRSGGGEPTIWACSGMIDDPTGERNWVYAEGRSLADVHYERSRWSDYRQGGDSDVIELIAAYEALLDSQTFRETPNSSTESFRENADSTTSDNHIPDAGKMIGWIKCSERLPDKNVFVLAHDEVGTVKAYICIHTGEWIRDNGDELYAVTHWMPLPEAPHEGQ